MCNACIGLQVACRYAARANQRLARSRSKVKEATLQTLRVGGSGRQVIPIERGAASQANVDAAEKKARAIAAVQCVIADRKRLREQDTAQMLQAEPKAKQCKQDNRAEMKATAAEPKRKADLDSAGAQETQRAAKERAERAETTREKNGDLQAKGLKSARSRQKATRHAEARKEMQTRQPCKYICPQCHETVRSSVRCGEVDHRRGCGNRFRVKDGCVITKAYVYICPFCKGEILSNVKTGQIDHRSVCGNRFYVKDSRVSSRTRQYAHSCPVCHTVVWSSTSCGQVRVKHDTPAGKPCKKTKWHVPAQKAKGKQ